MFHDPKVKFLFGDVCSKDIVDQIPRNIDFLFSDTIHFDFQIRDEFEIYQHLLSDKALVAIDDIKLNDKGVFFEELKSEKWDLTNLCHESGWGLFLFERKKPQKEKDLLISLVKVWERKYNQIYPQTLKISLVQKVKNQFKKMKYPYSLYTKTYNKMFSNIKKIKNENNNSTTS